MPAPLQRYSYTMIRADLSEIPGILTTQGNLGYHLISIINTIDTSDINHQKYYMIWELPL